MVKQHDWVYKTVYNGYWVHCAECGKHDTVYQNEFLAKVRVRILRAVTLDAMFPRKLRSKEIKKRLRV